MKPLLITIPHSGEAIPPQAPWLKNLDEVQLMYDVDRYVDVLYRPIIDELNVLSATTAWHRYAVDLNRDAQDVDQEAVEGSANAPGTFPRGLHWVYDTGSKKIMPQPISKAQHEEIVKLYFRPFHAQVEAHYKMLRAEGHTAVFHLDVHSMPSLGTTQHRDPGQARAEVVISDCKGKSCDPKFLELVTTAYRQQGFQIAINWPYFGGKVTETYGRPEQGQHAIQIELNRALYMNEQTKRLKSECVLDLQLRLGNAVRHIAASLPLAIG